MEPLLRFRSRRGGIELRLISEHHASLLRVESQTNNEALFQTRLCCVVQYNKRRYLYKILY